MRDTTPWKIIALILLPIIAAAVWKFTSVGGGTGSGDDMSDKDAHKNEPEVSLISNWSLPEELTEVSGIAWIDSTSIACVEDESGIIFIYNLRDNRIQRRIPFAGKGDYEGIALKSSTAYVLRADGTIFEVLNYLSDQPKVNTFDTFLSADQDCESLFYQPSEDRLLLAVKADDPFSKAYKGIYAFDLKTKKLARTPVFKLDLDHEIFDILEEKKPEDRIRPSDIAVHPQTGIIYILEGTSPKLLLMDGQNGMQRLYDLKKSMFPQPEGITFSPDGKLFISSEGNDGPGAISLIELK